MSSAISLRKRRGDKKAKNVPTISAPRQISAPMPVMSRPSMEASEPQARLDAPRDRPRMGDRTAEAVKRRYSQKVTLLPSDFSAGPVPDLPPMPTQYRQREPPDEARPDGGEPGRMRLDLKALRDPNLRAEQCESRSLSRLVLCFALLCFALLCFALLCSALLCWLATLPTGNCPG